MSHLVKSSDKEELQGATSHSGDGAPGTCCRGRPRAGGQRGEGWWGVAAKLWAVIYPSNFCVSAAGTGGVQGERVTGNAQTLVFSFTK